MSKLAVKTIPPDAAKLVRDTGAGDKELDHPLYVVEKRKGTGKATCRQCEQPIKEGESTLYFHYAPEDDNVWIRTRGTIHADDCQGDSEQQWTKCPKCRKQVPRGDWRSHWQKEKGKRVAAVHTGPVTSVGYDACPSCDGEAGCRHCGGSGLAMMCGDCDRPVARKASSPDWSHSLMPHAEPISEGSCELCGKPASHLVKGNPESLAGRPVCSDHLPPGMKRSKRLATIYLTPVTEPAKCSLCDEEATHQASARPDSKGSRPLCDSHSIESGGRTAEVSNPLKKNPKYMDEAAPEQGLDPTAGESGNQTSNYEPRVDPAMENKGKDTAKMQLDQEARKLQRGMKGLDQFAGFKIKDEEDDEYPDNWRDLDKGDDDEEEGEDELDHLRTATIIEEPTERQLRNPGKKPVPFPRNDPLQAPGIGRGPARPSLKDPGSGSKSGPVRTRSTHPAVTNCANCGKDHAVREDRPEECLKANTQFFGFKLTAGYKRDWWTQEGKPETHEECYRCGGTGRNTSEYADNDDDIACRACAGSGITKKYDFEPRSPAPSSATDLRPWKKLHDGNRNEGPYPSSNKDCHSCRGTGKGNYSWNPGADCYACHGEGKVWDSDIRNHFEDALERHSQSGSTRHIVGLANNTGLHEDGEQYHVKLHNTDVLSFHKTKPEVTLNTGGWDTVTTKQRMNGYLPRDMRIGSEEVRPGSHSWEKNELVVHAPQNKAYIHKDGMTVNTETGEAEGHGGELQQCGECHRLREPGEEMAKHQKRHDNYRANFEKNPFSKCGPCNGTGTTDDWHVPCKDCKATGINKDNSQCQSCRASGITYHAGPRPNASGQCSNCDGAGLVPKRRPAER